MSIDIAKRSTINLYDPVEQVQQFVLSQGQASCDMTVPTQFHVNSSAFKVTSGEQVVANVASSILSNAQAISDEVSRAYASEASLQSDISSETANRASADSTLQTNINTQAGRITQEITDRQSAVTAEQGRATGAEALLQENIDSEATSRASADTAEQTARIASDATLQSNIDNEAALRASADTTLEGKIDAQKARIDAILNLSTEELNQFHEIVTAYTNADSSLQNLITNLTTEFTALKAVVDNLAPPPSDP